jgi:phosphate transport system permease protein
MKDSELRLSKSWRTWRSLGGLTLNVVTGLLALIACVPLISLLVMLAYRGARALSLSCFTELPPAAMQQGGGFGNAIIGTIVMVGMGALISMPIGIATAIYLAILGGESRLASTVRFIAKTLSGLPSILAGVVAYAAIVMVTKTYSAPAGGAALALLMLPMVILTAEEAMRMVPSRMIDAAMGMGCTPTQMIWRVVLPTAMPGIVTGVMLAIARAAGETAPLLFTALFSNYWLIRDGGLQLWEPTASLAVLIYNFSGSPFDNQIELAWAAALVLVVLILGLNLTAQWVGTRNRSQRKS